MIKHVALMALYIAVGLVVASTVAGLFKKSST